MRLDEITKTFVSKLGKRERDVDRTWGRGLIIFFTMPQIMGETFFRFYS